MHTTTAKDIVDRYLACWNEPDSEARAELIEQTWTAEARSVDPLADVKGREAIEAMIAGTQSQFPGHRFELDGAIVEHHDVLHWGWRLLIPTGDQLLSGFDVATIVEGRIDFLAGFFHS